MIAYFINLQQNIFLLSLIASVFLGLSCAYLLRNTVILFSSEKEIKPLESSVSKNTGKYSKQSSLPDETDFNDSIATGNLFRGSATEGEESTENTGIEKINLLGVLSGSTWFARAMILLEGEKLVKSYAIDDKIAGVRLVSIRKNSILVESPSGERLEISVGNSNNPKTPKASTATSSANPKGGKTHKIVLNRDRFKQLISNQAELFRLKFSPSIQKGKIKGWNLLRVPKDHFLYSMGARSGDIIRRYNGQELESQDRMISMWQSLQTANEVVVDLERKKQILTYEITIQ